MTVLGKEQSIGVKQADELINAMNSRLLEVLKGVMSKKDFNDGIKNQTVYDNDAYKLAFETLAKHVRAYAEYHDNGSLIVSLIQESSQDFENVSPEKYYGAFTLIQKSIAKMN